MLRGRRPNKPASEDFEDFEGKLWDLTVGCWDETPEARPKIDEVLERVSAFHHFAF